MLDNQSKVIYGKILDAIQSLEELGGSDSVEDYIKSLLGISTMLNNEIRDRIFAALENNNRSNENE